MKIAVILFSLGGPDSLDTVEPFLINVFSDPAILTLPAFLRRSLARLIAKRRGPVAREIYAKIGGRSPIVEETQRQGAALEKMLAIRGHDTKTAIAMRAWKPFATEAAEKIRCWSPDQIILLPLYPQFSTTTTASSLEDWRKAKRAVGLTARETRICCYPWDMGFIEAQANLIRQGLMNRKPDVDYRLLLTAHGLPKRMISRGDPYQWQVEKSAEAIAPVKPVAA